MIEEQQGNKDNSTSASPPELPRASMPGERRPQSGGFWSPAKNAVPRLQRDCPIMDGGRTPKSKD